MPNALAAIKAISPLSNPSFLKRSLKKSFSFLISSKGSNVIESSSPPGMTSLFLSSNDFVNAAALASFSLSVAFVI